MSGKGALVPRIITSAVLAILIVSTILPYAIIRATAVTVPTDFAETLVSSVPGVPMDLVWTPDGRILIPIQTGQLRVYKDGSLLSTPAIDLSSIVCSDLDRGLGGVTVHPNFASNHYIYLYYTYKKNGTCNNGQTDDPVNRLSRFTLPDNNIIDPTSELVLLDTPPLPINFHNGGDLKFGHDGYLYITSGDGGSACCSPPSDPNAAEELNNLLGKILRVTDTGDIPSTNPYQGPGTARCNLDGVPPNGSPSGARCQEIYASGLRNPFRFAFDTNTAPVKFYINDVGEDTWEEIDLGTPAADYGWPVREGPCAQSSTTDCGTPPSGLTNPIFWYGHNVTVNGSGCDAITGGAFVPIGIWPGSYDGAYLHADYTCGQIWALKPNGLGGYRDTPFATVSLFGPISMRFGPYGNGQALYYVTKANGGQLRRIAYTGALDAANLVKTFRTDWADYDNDGKVTIQDIQPAILAFDTANAYWDYYRNGKVDIVDIATLVTYFNTAFSYSPYPGQGLPPGTIDQSWAGKCSLLPPLDQNYCLHSTGTLS